MRTAPPVRMSVGAHAPWRWFCALVPALALSVGSLWLLQRAGLDAAVVMLAALCAGTVAWAIGFAAGPHRRVRQLAWDGQRWTLDGEGVVPQVALDFGNWMLLRVRPTAAGRVHWLPLAWPQAGTDRHLARAALFDRPIRSIVANDSGPASHV